MKLKTFLYFLNLLSYELEEVYEKMRKICIKNMAAWRYVSCKLGYSDESSTASGVTYTVNHDTLIQTISQVR